MFDIWGFLLQTLTASSVGVLLLIIKALLKDKLPPKWHFASWGVLALIMLLPAGFKGRYTIVQWQILVELLKVLVGDYSTTKVLFPLPIIKSLPHSPMQWLFVIYAFGIALFIFKYLISYIRLRFILSKGKAPKIDTVEKVKYIAFQLDIKPCKVVEVKGLPSAFVCGVFRPVLALPEDKETDSKVILHELIHLKHHDTFFSVIICLLKSLHWCNPFIAYCASRATMDMENRCDQYVLEVLKGEQRREYGHILLSMVNERFTGTPATSCINNGGKSIRERIETIARFKKYPKGMGLVSSCVLLILTFSLALGTRATAANKFNISQPDLLYAKAKSIPCTTLAGAFDAYASSVIKRNDSYRIMCAPEALQEEIYKKMKEGGRESFCVYESGDNIFVYDDEPFYIYNMEKIGTDAYEGLLVFNNATAPKGVIRDYDKYYIAMQKIKARKENGRWVVMPLEKFRIVESDIPVRTWDTYTLPSIRYTGNNGKIAVDVNYQIYFTVDSYTSDQINSSYPFGVDFSNTFYTRVPRPDADFLNCSIHHNSSITHLGTKEERAKIESVAISMAESYSGTDDTEKLSEPFFDEGNTFFSSSTSGEVTAGGVFDEDSDTIDLGGGGSSFSFDGEILYPDHFVVDLYVNKEYNDRLILRQREAE